MTTALHKRIVFVINSLGVGGAERVMSHVLRMAPPGWDCHLILLDRETERRSLPSFVEIHRLDCHSGLVAGIRGLHKKFLELRPDLVVSFLVRANVACLIAAQMTGAPVIISERSHLSTHLDGRHKGLKRWAAGVLPRLTYSRARHVIAVSEGVRSDLVEKFGVKPDRVIGIPNPYDLARMDQDAKSEPEVDLPDRFIVGVGRLVGSKGFADLIDAYFRARVDVPLCILGEGPERGALEARASALGLQDRVHLLGYLKNPFAVIGRADLFISASHCEGFPNAMAEAMALGVPVISTDCPSGPAEILDGAETVHCVAVHEGKFGLLVPMKRPDVLAHAIRMMSESERHDRYSQLARQRMADYGIEAITNRYWKTFEAVLADQTIREPAPMRQKRTHVPAGPEGA